MKYHLAQLNIARFRLPQEHPDNLDFINNLDRVNAIAESQKGFVWRLTGEANNALDVNAFEDPNVVANLSVWESLDSLAAFVYRNKAHRDIMRRRAEWFEKIDFYLVLWWLPANQRPTFEEARRKLELLSAAGPNEEAFTFKNPYPAPNPDKLVLVGEANAVIDGCV